VDRDRRLDPPEINSLESTKGTRVATEPQRHNGTRHTKTVFSRSIAEEHACNRLHDVACVRYIPTSIPIPRITVAPPSNAMPCHAMPCHIPAYLLGRPSISSIRFAITLPSTRISPCHHYQHRLPIALTCRSDSTAILRASRLSLGGIRIASNEEALETLFRRHLDRLE
jgi:hypothetical protein